MRLRLITPHRPLQPQQRSRRLVTWSTAVTLRAAQVNAQKTGCVQNKLKPCFYSFSSGFVSLFSDLDLMRGLFRVMNNSLTVPTFSLSPIIGLFITC